MRQPVDRALRRLVAELASATPDDVQVLLARLEDRHRQTVERLLLDYRGATRENKIAAFSHKSRPVAVGGLSTWLAERLLEPDDLTAGARKRFRQGSETGLVAALPTITPATRAALRSCAEALDLGHAPRANRVAAWVRRWLDRIPQSWLRRDAW